MMDAVNQSWSYLAQSFCLLLEDLMTQNSVLEREGTVLSLCIFWVLETCR